MGEQFTVEPASWKVYGNVESVTDGESTRHPTKIAIRVLLEKTQIPPVTLTRRDRRFVLITEPKYLVAPALSSIN